MNHRQLLIISGGQTGVDQAALRAARRHGIPTGGWVAKGWRTEDGPAPWLADFKLEETLSSSYTLRTKLNIDRADATLILIGSLDDLRGGTALTLSLCQRAAAEDCKPFALVNISLPDAVSLADQLLHVVAHLDDPGTPLEFNIAGPRESRHPGIGAQAEEFLCSTLAKSGYSVVTPDPVS